MAGRRSDQLMPGERFGELLEAVGHLPELCTLSARLFDCSTFQGTFQGIFEAAPQLHELRLRDCLLTITSQDLRALDALKALLEV